MNTATADYWVACRNGSGDKAYPIKRAHRQPFGNPMIEAVRQCPDDDARYWMVRSLFETIDAMSNLARAIERERWRAAAIQNRIKVNRRKKSPTCEVVEAAQ
jgi:hypothetical protein